MLVSLLTYNWMPFLLVLITSFLVSKNRAFSKKIRTEFQMVLILCLFSYVFYICYALSSGQSGDLTHSFFSFARIFLRPIIICILAHLFYNLKRDFIDYVFAGVMGVIIVVAFVSELLVSDFDAVTDTLCVISCVFYYYIVMQTYKKDELTRLPIRHNLNYEMEDIVNKYYDVVLIDVDDFKLFNDRYGHDRGDEVLVAVVDAINECLQPGCRLYRFGGDEFIIISRKISVDKLKESLDRANSILSSKDLHFSYGIAAHKPGEASNNAITEADEKMYDNKKELRGDGVWDSMTGLFNYHGFLAELYNFKKKAESEGHKVSLVAVDVERLSSINMAYGYVEGNFVIKTLSELVESSLNGKGIACHLNGDEFVVALESEQDSTIEVANYRKRLSNSMENACEFAEADYSIILNFGDYTLNDEDDLTIEELVNNVLYVKQAEKDASHKNDLAEVQDYDAAEENVVLDIIANNKLKYFFQPIVSAKDGEILAYETLMRSDTEQMVSPITILKYAERNNKSYDIERYTFFNVFDRITKGNDFPENAKLFINSIPGYMLNESDYSDLRNMYGDLFSRMVIEITEQREINDDALATINMRRSQDGFMLAIDDYGSGYSNTNSLLRYMPQVIKLDRLLITGIERNAKKQFFVNSIISFARDNDMKTLAEGVETEAELKVLIRLGVDMIQGYYTARPAAEIINEIDGDIKRTIIEENLVVAGNKRMVYTVADNCEISSVRLAMEDYSKINVSSEYVSIVGNAEYTADMVIRVKEGTNCEMKLSNVKLNSVDDEPCIDIGEGAHLTIVLDGDNMLNAKGIHVPSGSSLTVKGMGNLEILTRGHDCYAIGCDSENKVGNITMRSSGNIVITVDGEICTAIGGGIVADDSQINVHSGLYNIRVAGVDAIGVGAREGNIPIMIKDSEFNVDFRVYTGIVIGALNGKQNISISNFNMNIVGSGANVSGVGSINDTHGDIIFESGSYRIKLNGQKLHLIGASSGELNIKGSHVKFEMLGEGDNVLGYGSFDGKSHLLVDECSVDLVINASNPLDFGTAEDEKEFGFRGPLTVVKVNGETKIIGSDI